MGYKKVCLDCRKSFNDNTNNEMPCPHCGKAILFLSHRFRPPKKTDNEKWQTMKYLIENGFHYDHVYQKIETNNKGVTSYENYATYPDNLRDAKEFVERYKNQARK